MAGIMFGRGAALFARAARRWTRDDAAAIARRLAPSVSARGSVLDVGGGTGALAGLLAAEMDCSVTVLDPSPQMLRYAEGLAGVTATLGDSAALPFDTATFDAAIVVDAFHHFRRQREAIGEIARVLRPGGTVYIADEDPSRAAVRFVGALERLAGEPGSFMDPDALVRAFAEVGVSGSCRERNEFSYVFVGTKADPG